MFHTSKSKLAHAAVIAGTISLLLSSSAFARFNGAGGYRGGNFGGVHAPTPGNAGIAGTYFPIYTGPGAGAIGSVQLGAANPPPRSGHGLKGPRVNKGGCYFAPCR